MSLPYYFRYSTYSQSFISVQSSFDTSNTTFYLRSDCSEDRFDSTLNQKYKESIMIETTDLYGSMKNLNLLSTLQHKTLYNTNIPLYKLEFYDEETVHIINIETNEISFTMKKGYHRKDSINVWSGTNTRRPPEMFTEGSLEKKQFRIWNKFENKYGIGAMVKRKKFSLENLILGRDNIIVGVEKGIDIALVMILVALAAEWSFPL